MIKTGGLQHLHLVVRNVERSLRFYQSVFGMQERFRVGPHMVFISTPGSDDLITLNQDERERDQAGHSGGISHFGFRLLRGSDLDAAAREVEAGGGKVISRGEHAPGVPFVYVSDPDGYMIELGNP